MKRREAPTGREAGNGRRGLMGSERSSGGLSRKRLLIGWNAARPVPAERPDAGAEDRWV